MRQSGHKLHMPSLSNENSLKTLVENRTVHSLSSCELNYFETYEESKLVPLKFNDLVVTSMLRGKKVMHLFDDPEFVYLPGETVIIPSNVEMKIDFPEATFNNPTQCLALAIDQAKIADTLDFLNEKYPKEGNLWKLNYNNYFFYNNQELAASIDKLMQICTGTNLTKDILADLALQELLVHIIQSQTLTGVNEMVINDANSAMSHIVTYIRERISDKLTMKELTDTACMSKASFYRFFKRELGVSPIEFVLNEKIRFAKQLLKDQSLQVNEVSFEVGFDDTNYFIRAFKKIEGITPKQYQLIQGT